MGTVVPGERTDRGELVMLVGFVCCGHCFVAFCFFGPILGSFGVVDSHFAVVGGEFFISYGVLGESTEVDFFFV